MTSIVFGLEILIHKIEFFQVDSFPSLTIIVDNSEPQILLPYSTEAHSGDIWDEEKAFQLIYIIDAFESCVTWPVTFELVSPVETTALGKCTFELKPLICDAIAAHGCSPIASQSCFLRDFERHEVANMSFDIRAVFFKMCQKRAATINSQVKNMPKSARYHALSIKKLISPKNSVDEHGTIKSSESYRVMPNFRTGHSFESKRRRRESEDPHADTSIVPRHINSVATVSPLSKSDT